MTSEPSEPLTWKAICERYPDEWVVLVEVDWVNDTDLDFAGFVRRSCRGSHCRRS